MSSNMALIENTLRGDSIRAAAEAMGRAVAITADELITAKSGLLGRWGNRVERRSAGLAVRGQAERDLDVRAARSERSGAPAGAPARTA